MNVTRFLIRFFVVGLIFWSCQEPMSPIDVVEYELDEPDSNPTIDESSFVENGDFTYDPPGPATSATVTPTDLSCVCTSNITDMNDLFNRDGVYGKSTFNTDINSWDVSNVTNMMQLFANATVFNQPLNNWDVSLVENMMNMFVSASSFNQELDSWNVGLVETMEGLSLIHI